MEELFRKEEQENTVSREVHDEVLQKLVDVRDEIMSLNNEINEFRQMLDDLKHEDEVVITTKHRIKSIELDFAR